MLLSHWTDRACSRTLLSAGKSIEISTAMMPITTSNSTRVKSRSRRAFVNASRARLIIPFLQARTCPDVSSAVQQRRSQVPVRPGRDSVNRITAAVARRCQRVPVPPRRVAAMGRHQKWLPESPDPSN